MQIEIMPISYCLCLPRILYNLCVLCNCWCFCSWPCMPLTLKINIHWLSKRNWISNNSLRLFSPRSPLQSFAELWLVVDILICQNYQRGKPATDDMKHNYSILLSLSPCLWTFNAFIGFDLKKTYIIHSSIWLMYVAAVKTRVKDFIKTSKWQHSSGKRTSAVRRTW